MRAIVRVALTAMALPLAVGGCASGGGSSAAPTSRAAATSGATATSRATAANGTATPAPTAAQVPLLLYIGSGADDEPLNGEIWVIGADGTGARKIANGVEASWSHDGKTIHVVSADENCLPSITDYPVDGGSGRPVGASLKPGDNSFSWSPDDSQVVYYRWVNWLGALCPWGDGAIIGADDDTYAQAVRTMSASGANERQLVAKMPGRAYLFSWAPDGSSVIIDATDLERTSSLQRVDMATGTMTQLGTSTKLRDSLTVSPDTTKIAYAVGIGDPAIFHLHTANIDGTADRDLGVIGRNYVGDIEWSPAGNLVGVNVYDNDLAGVVIIVPPAGGAVTTVYSDADVSGGFLAWSADGSRLVAVSDTDSMLVVVGADGSGARVLPGTDGAYGASWQP